MAAHAKDIRGVDFQKAVIDRSAERPVVVDFWAPWCGPCRVLGPTLEKEVAAQGGAVELCKLDTDENPELAAAFQIQGIPAVKAFRGGEVVAEFVGARPAEFVRAWLKTLVPSPAAEALRRGQEAVAAGRLADAEAALRLALGDGAAETAIRDQAAIALARLLVDAGRAGEARVILAMVDPRGEAADALPAIERMLAFSEDARAGGGEAAARAALDRNPRDLDARYALASALAARSAHADALDQFLDLVGRSRKFRDDAARLAMLAIFEHLGPGHPLSQDFRRRLQIVL